MDAQKRPKIRYPRKGWSDYHVSITKPIQDTKYRNKDFEIEDPDGYILCFGKSVDN
nr:hypothetical protein [uncultured Psychroserpens sp.]